MFRVGLGVTGTLFVSLFVGAATVSATTAESSPWYETALWIGAAGVGAAFLAIGLTYLGLRVWERPVLRFGPSIAPDALLDRRLYSDKTIQLPTQVRGQIHQLLLKLNVRGSHPRSGTLRFVEKSGSWWHRRWPHADADSAGVNSALGPDPAALPDGQWYVRGATGHNVIPMRFIKTREPRHLQPIWIRAGVYANTPGRWYLELKGTLSDGREFATRRPVKFIEQ